MQVTCRSHGISLLQALAFFITQMDAVVNSPFVVIYLNTCTVEENVYDSEFYKQLYLSLDDRYIDHLRGLYIVHPSFWMKVSAGGMRGVGVHVREVYKWIADTYVRMSLNKGLKKLYLM